YIRIICCNTELLKDRNAEGPQGIRIRLYFIAATHCSQEFVGWRLAGHLLENLLRSSAFSVLNFEPPSLLLGCSSSTLRWRDLPGLTCRLPEPKGSQPGHKSRTRYCCH